MKTWYVTFGQREAYEEHPTFPQAHPDGWVEILADTEIEAREIAVAWLGSRWSFMYAEDVWEPSWFPRGCLLRIGEEVS